ncbi:MAG TPA: DUF983 domain-containing protein [Rhizomicrobium sp.]|jgi:uncharacterized protein (DUF983 family)|nr:DUF983 domain-containing protein [Rhizomicrobium sp.]
MEGPAPSTLISSLLGRCPRCGQGRLFAGYLRIAPHCPYCGLDYVLFDVGDGAAVFVILIVGFLVVGGALVVEIVWSPPYWVHAALWLPTIAILALGGLRLVKSVLIVLQYKHQAREGRLA